jgi:hypothetical protein
MPAPSFYVPPRPDYRGYDWFCDAVVLLPFIGGPDSYLNDFGPFRGQHTNLVKSGNVTYGHDPQFGGYYDFPGGLEDDIEVYDSAHLDLTRSVTICCTFRADSHTTGTNENRLFHKGSSHSSMAYGLDYIDGTDTGNVLSGVFIVDNQAVSGSPQTIDPLVDGKWYTLVGVRDHQRQWRGIYLDGVLQEHSSHTGGIVTNNEDLVIGGRTGSTGDNLDGKIAFCGLWSRPFTAREVRALGRNPKKVIFGNQRPTVLGRNLPEPLDRMILPGRRMP